VHEYTVSELAHVGASPNTMTTMIISSVLIPSRPSFTVQVSLLPHTVSTAAATYKAKSEIENTQRNPIKLPCFGNRNRLRLAGQQECLDYGLCINGMSIRL
jgi:hypothetical protein